MKHWHPNLSSSLSSPGPINKFDEIFSFFYGHTPSFCQGTKSTSLLDLRLDIRTQSGRLLLGKAPIARIYIRAQDTTSKERRSISNFTGTICLPLLT